MTQWQKSKFSNGTEGGDCIELACEGRGLLLRESEDPTHILAPAPTALAALLSHFRDDAVRPSRV
ncbi:DUF397 domain-containing protein [Streptomyces sp. NPDC048442]|uniref:DUF397 domain-containing protein n=1 Tax=Streptomyces sp. NPDC048442 TaxID=3154823 RepID=UPI003425FAB7